MPGMKERGFTQPAKLAKVIEGAIHDGIEVVTGSRAAA